MPESLPPSIMAMYLFLDIAVERCYGIGVMDGGAWVVIYEQGWLWLCDGRLSFGLLRCIRCSSAA